MDNDDDQDTTLPSFIRDRSKKPKEASVTLGAYRTPNSATTREGAPIIVSMQELAVHDVMGNTNESSKIEKNKKGEKSSKSKSKSPTREKEKDVQKKGKEPKVDAPKSSKKEKGEKATTAAPKSAPQKEKESHVISDRSAGGVPLTLVHGVVDHGMKPLFAHLSSKLMEFKSHIWFKRGAQYWNLLSGTPPNYSFRAQDFAHFTADDLYQNFQSTKTDAGRTFEKYLDDEVWIWDCMMRFEAMKKETTTHEEFMFLFRDNMEMISDTTFATENSENVKELQALFDKHWDSKKKRPKKL